MYPEGIKDVRSWITPGRVEAYTKTKKDLDRYQDFAPVLVIFLEGLIGPGGFV